MIYDNTTYTAALAKATTLNNLLSEEQLLQLTHKPAVGQKPQKPYYRADALCVPLANEALFTWPANAQEMAVFILKCEAAKSAYAQWTLWASANQDKTLEQSVEKYSELLLIELTPYL